MKQNRTDFDESGPAPRRSRLVPNQKILVFAAIGLVFFAVCTVAIRHHSDSDREPSSQAPQAATNRPIFVGSKSCGACHISEFESWLGSHHQLAMQPATKATVLGNFAQTKFADHASSATFFRDRGKFMVRTEGPDRARHDYQIKYTFGVSPLQQYLIELPGGRLQAFGIAWDSRTRAIGGQRWFSLYPGANLGTFSPLRWTAADQTWNYRCADCHSTNVRKNYHPAIRTYATTYAEIAVGCEACHGPGSNHVSWAREPSGLRARDPSHGLTIALDQRAGISWSVDPLTGDLRRSKPLRNNREVEMCARCHSLRTPIHEDYVHGQPLGDDYRTALLDEGLYFPDGQIEGEVYEYGSFIQSRMFHAGVVCSDCHDPHSSRLRAAANKLCTQCHLADKYDSSRHHFHFARSPGSQCIECHMPPRIYMQVDHRRDHSIRVPRPDLSLILGTPNACNNCHVNKTAQWAADRIAKWYGAARIGFQQFGPALQAGRVGAPEAQSSLAELASDLRQPALARATALDTLAHYPSARNNTCLRRGSEDQSALVRRAAAALLSSIQPDAQPSAIRILLDDPVRAVRIEAAESLAGVPHNALPDNLANVLDRASAEFVSAQRLNGDGPEAHLDLGLFFARQEKFRRAEIELATALTLDPSFSPAALNLADLFRQLGRDDEAATVLQQALRRTPDDASLRYAFGLLKVREKRRAQALDLFAAAARLDPSNPNYAYAYALTLYGAGNINAAIEVLERSLKFNPYHRETLEALVCYCDRVGDHAQALNFARLLKSLSSED